MEGKSVTIAMRPVILSDYKMRTFLAMEVKIFDGIVSNAHHRYEGWLKYKLIQCDSDVAKLAGMTPAEFRQIGLKSGYEDEHGLLVFSGRNSANELVCRLWSRQLPPIHATMKPGERVEDIIERIRAEERLRDQKYQELQKKLKEQEDGHKTLMDRVMAEYRKVYTGKEPPEQMKAIIDSLIEKFKATNC